MERSKKIDVIRGLCIILMVIGHSGFLYKDYIYLFHMPAFFMLSGYLYREKYSQNVRSVTKFVKRRLRSLWFPYFVWQSIFISLNNVFVSVNIYTNNPEFVRLTPSAHKELFDYMSLKDTAIGIGKSFLFLSETQVGGGFWFLQILFSVSILYCIVDFIIKNVTFRLRLQFGIFAVLLLAGYLNAFPVNMLNKICSCCFLFYLGKMIHSFDKKIVGDLNAVHYVCIICISTITLFGLGQIGHVSLNINYYENPLFLLSSSIVGWLLVYSLGSVIASAPLKSLTAVIQTLGRHTVAILALHFLAFKIVSLMQIWIYHKPMILLASYPVLYRDGLWWVLYAFAGLAIPCVSALAYQKAKAWAKSVF